MNRALRTSLSLLAAGALSLAGVAVARVAASSAPTTRVVTGGAQDAVLQSVAINDVSSQCDWLLPRLDFDPTLSGSAASFERRAPARVLRHPNPTVWKPP